MAKIILKDLISLVRSTYFDIYAHLEEKNGSNVLIYSDKELNSSWKDYKDLLKEFGEIEVEKITINYVNNSLVIFLKAIVEKNT